MLQNANVKTIFYAGLLGLLLSGCSATLDGLKEDLGKVTKRSATSESSPVEKSEPAEGSEESQVAESTEESVLVQIQTILKEQGYYSGEINGEFNAPTEAAIQDFQLDKGLRIDGRATPELLEVLKSS